MEKIKDMFLRFFIRVKDQKGEVSVEWAMVAVVMCLIILAAYPQISDALKAGMDNVKGKLGTSSLP